MDEMREQRGRPSLDRLARKRKLKETGAKARLQIRTKGIGRRNSHRCRSLNGPVPRIGGTKKMDSFTHLEGSNAHMSPKEQNADPWSKDGRIDVVSAEKKAAVHEEMKRMNQLPANSKYATHRLRVLNKILQLLSIQRTISQEEELQLLFAGLSL